MKIRPTFGLLISRRATARAFLLDPATVALVLGAVAASSGIYYLFESPFLVGMWLCLLFVLSWLGDWTYAVDLSITNTNITVWERRLFGSCVHKETVDGKFMLQSVPDQILRPVNMIIFRSLIPHLADYSFWCCRPETVCAWLNEQRIRLGGLNRIPRASILKVVR